MKYSAPMETGMRSRDKVEFRSSLQPFFAAFFMYVWERKVVRKLQTSSFGECVQWGKIVHTVIVTKRATKFSRRDVSYSTSSTYYVDPHAIRTSPTP